MRVLWFSNTPANATEFIGSGTVAGGWMKSLDRALQKKVELHIVFYHPRRMDPFQYLDTNYHPISIENWKLKAVLKRIWREFIDKQDLSKYLDIIDRVKPDIIHVHGTENPFSCIIPNIQIPVVVSIQGCITVYNHKFHSGFTSRYLKSGLAFNVNSIKEFLVKSTFNQTKLEFKKIARREQRNLMYTKNIFGRTAWDKRISSVLAPASQYYHGDEMLRSIFYLRRWKKKTDNKLVIHTTNGNNPYKGFETLCEALFELSGTITVPVEWRVAGISDNDDIVKVTKKKLKDRFPLSGLVLLGNVSEDILVEWMCEANIYVSTSHIENSPNSLCEAMLIGMPCIATFAGGTGSLLNDGEEGILIQDGDPWVMAGAILELYNNPASAIKYGNMAREKAIKRHDKKRIVDDLLGTYKLIAGSNNP